MEGCSDKIGVTVIVLTKNEEAVVARAIGSAIPHFSEVIVLDSYSTDDTVAVATAAGATVVENVFRGYASQRNFALRELPKKNEWVFFLDADEVFSAELISELKQNFSAIVSRGYGLVLVRRKDFFFGRWIKRSSGYPTWFGRLCHCRRVWVSREINEEYNCDGPVARLSAHIHHYPFAKGISQWVDRHNRYSTLEAEIIRDDSVLRFGELFASDPTARRRAQKRIYMSLPFRPLVGFILLFVLRGGFLDGKPGFHYARLRAVYEYLIDLKVAEAQFKEVEKWEQ